MASNANRQEATTTNAYERSIIDAIVADAEAAYDNNYAVCPSDGIRGALYGGVVGIITTRANEELARVGRPTDGDEAVAFRTWIIAGVMYGQGRFLRRELFQSFHWLILTTANGHIMSAR